MTPQSYLPSGGGAGGRSGGPKQNTLFNKTSCEKITTFWSNNNPGIIDRKGCTGLAKNLWDKSLCGRHSMCPKCNEIAAARKAAKYHRILNDDFLQSEEYGWPLRVDVLTTTLPGQHSWVRRASLHEQYHYLTERTNVSKLGGAKSMRGLNYKLNEWGYFGGAHFIEFTWNKHRKWWNVHNHTIAVGYVMVRRASLHEQYHYLTERTNVSKLGGAKSMRGLNYKLNEWGYFGGAHFIEFTWNKHRKWWNVHNHTIAVGYEDDVTVPVKETSQKDWSGLRYEKTPYVCHGGFTNEFKENGLGRRYSLDTAEHHEVADCIGYVAKLAYVTKPVKAPKEKRRELMGFFRGKTGKEPRLTRPFGDWCRSRS